MRFGLNYKIPAGICGLIVGLTIAIAGIGDSSVLQAIEARARRDLLSAEETFQNFQKYRMQELTQAAAFLTAARSFQDTDDFQAAVQRTIPSDLLIVAGKEGYGIAGAGASAQGAQDWGKEPALQKALEGTAVQGVETIGKSVYRIAARPILSQGRIAGAVLAGSVIDEAAMGELEAMMNCRIGLFLGDQRIGTLSAAVLGEGERVSAGGIKARDADKIRLVKIENERYLARDIPAQILPGGVLGRYVLAKSLDKELGFYWSLRRRLLVVTALCVGAALMAGLFFARGITGPIRLLVRGTRRISSGDFAARVPVSSDDEVGELARSFNQMTEDLQNTTVSKFYVDNIIKFMADTLIVVNPDMTIRMVNQETLDLLGYAQEELIGRPAGMIFDDKGEEFFEEFILKEFLLSSELKSRRLNYRRKDGRTVPMLLSGSVLKNEKGEIISIICVAKDITKETQAQEILQKTNEELEARVKERTLQLRKVNEQLLRDIEARKATEAELMEAHKELAGREKSLRDMFEKAQKSYAELTQTQNRLVQSEKLASIGLLAAGIAHEIKSPVSFIHSNLQILEEYVAKYGRLLEAVAGLKEAAQKKDSAQAETLAVELDRLEEEMNLGFIAADARNLIKESRSGIERIKRIVTDLRVFSREDGGAREVADVEEILDSVLNIVWNEIKYKAELKKDYGAPPLVRCNTQKLGQVFINLLINASQAIENQGTIHIKTYAKDNRTCVKISDTGRGIPPEQMKKIFEPFFTTKPAAEGTGLGLSISYDIIKQHGGEITAVSEAGAGTTFTVVLPVAGEES